MGSRTEEHHLDKLGDRLRRARLKAGFKTTAEAAKAAGIGKGSLDSYECGRNMPGAEALDKLATTYGTTVDALLGRSDTGSIIVRVNQSLVDRVLIDRVLATTNPTEIRDFLNWQPDMLLCMPEVPLGTEVMERSEAQRLWDKVMKHIEEHAPEHAKKWRQLHRRPRWLTDGQVEEGENNR